MTNRSGRARHAALTGALAMTVAAAVATMAQSSGDKWWTGYGNGPDSSRYFASAEIDRSNVTRLQVAWTYPHGDTGSIPVVVRGVAYGRGRNGSLFFGIRILQPIRVLSRRPRPSLPRWGLLFNPYKSITILKPNCVPKRSMAYWKRQRRSGPARWW